MSSLPQNTWHKIAKEISEINFSPNGLAELKVDGRIICVGVYKSELFSCTQKCPHAGGELVNGHIDAVGNIVCPLHNYKFNPKNGRNISGEGYFLKTFAVEIRGDGVYVCFSE